MNKISVWFLITVGLMPQVSSAYVYEIKVLRKWDKQRNRYHCFIGFSDYHDKTSKANALQIAAIERMLAVVDKKNIKLLLEDLSSRGCGGRCSCGKFMVNSRGGLLGGLALSCRQQGFDVENLEYRYCRVSSLGPVLNNLDKSPHDFPSVTATSIDALAQEIVTIADEIDAYDDGHVLRTWYTNEMRDIQPQLSKWQQRECAQLTVAQYVEKYSNAQDRLEFLKHLLTFDSGLLDLKMAHAVLNSQHIPTIAAITGGSHIARVAEILTSMGYEQIYSTPVQYTKEHDLKRCVGSTVIDGCYCLRPEPIDCEHARKYLL